MTAHPAKRLQTISCRDVTQVDDGRSSGGLLRSYGGVPRAALRRSSTATGREDGRSGRDSVVARRLAGLGVIGGDRQRVKGATKVRLVSWNVNGRYGPVMLRQLAALRERDADIVALQEIRAKSLRVWREGLTQARLEHVLDSSDLVAIPSMSGREYRRSYFNLVASRWPLRRLPGLQLEFPERYLAARVGRPGAGFEIHTAHVPPGSTRGLVKVEMFDALHTRLTTPCERARIRCGDLNTPRAERDDGSVEFCGARNPPNPERRDNAERSVVLGLNSIASLTSFGHSTVTRRPMAAGWQGTAANRGTGATTTSSPPGA
jgi:exonuclease III